MLWVLKKSQVLFCLTLLKPDLLCSENNVDADQPASEKPADQGGAQWLTVVPTKSDSDPILCLQSLSKTFKFTLHLTQRESIDHLCIYSILRIGLIHT